MSKKTTTLTKSEFLALLNDVIGCIRRKELYTDVRRKRLMIKWIEEMIDRIECGEMFDDEDTFTPDQCTNLTDYIAEQVKLPRRLRTIL